MKPDGKNLRFFLGANTPQGFVSRFDQLADVQDGWRVMVIKGGPGSGKSTMMKQVADALQKDCESIEVIHCSSDVDSVDGVIAPGLKYAIADGTLPHAILPHANKSYHSGQPPRHRYKRGDAVWRRTIFSSHTSTAIRMRRSGGSICNRSWTGI